MKQINLSLATAGDVAVLRNGAQFSIETISPIKKGMYKFLLEMNLDASMYTLQGEYWHGETDGRDILDVLRNGASIFEQSNQ